ncbi:hypothetical protein BV20DRAFT_757779 [Pilatotrama ljubarskyi]|nr:hypothetical protein BV20DRAFT_757779 [Pilatotrama ljubarskyi]
MSLPPSDAASATPPDGLPVLSQPPSVESTLGALFVGTLVCTLLYGLTLYQTYRYYRLYPRDLKIFKILVPVVLVLETLHTAFAIETCYWYMIKNYANPVALLGYRYSLKLLIPLTGLTGILCNAFYARRVYLFGSKHRIFVAIATVFLLAKIGFTAAVAVEAFQSEYITSIATYSWMISATYGFTVGADGLLSATLIYILLASRTGFRRTDNVLESLALYTINTGLTTSIVGILVFIFALVQPHSFVWAAISVVSDKLYANAILAVLNSRHTMAGRMFEQTTDLETIGAQLEGRSRTTANARTSMQFRVRGSTTRAMEPTPLPALERTHTMDSGRLSMGGSDGKDVKRATPSL